jgi:hypothetical protein
MKKNIKIQVYDPNIKSAPFKLVTIDEFKAIIYDNSKNDPYGERKVFSIIRAIKTRNPNYDFRFYSENKDDIIAVVHNKNSPGTDHLWAYKHY